MYPTKCEVDGCTATRLYEGGISSTCMGFESYIENGVRHHHDPNSTWQQFTCSKGHGFTVMFDKSCPAPGCNFGKRKVA